MARVRYLHNHQRRYVTFNQNKNKRRIFSWLICCEIRENYQCAVRADNVRRCPARLFGHKCWRYIFWCCCKCDKTTLSIISISTFLIFVCQITLREKIKQKCLSQDSEKLQESGYPNGGKEEGKKQFNKI